MTKSHLAFALLSKLLWSALNIVSLVLIEKYFTSQEFGSFSLSISVAMFTSALINRPFYHDILRSFPYNRLRSLQGSYLAHKSLILLFDTARTCALAVVLSLALSRLFDLPDAAWMRDTAFLATVYGLQISINALMRATKNQVFLDTVALLEPVGKCALIPIASASSASLVFVYISSICLVLIPCSVLLLVRYGRINLKSSMSALRELKNMKILSIFHSSSYHKGWMAAALFIWIYNSSDKYIMQSAHGLAYLGAYAFMLQLYYNPSIVVTNQLLSTYEPEFFGADNKKEKIPLLTRLFIRLKPYPVKIPLLISAVAFYPLIVRLFTIRYAEVSIFWSYLLLFSGLLYGIGQLLILEIKKYATFSHLQSSIALPNFLGLLLNLLLVFHFGILGAITSIFITSVVKILLASRTLASMKANMTV